MFLRGVLLGVCVSNRFYRGGARLCRCPRGVYGRAARNALPLHVCFSNTGTPLLLRHAPSPKSRKERAVGRAQAYRGAFAAKRRLGKQMRRYTWFPCRSHERPSFRYTAQSFALLCVCASWIFPACKHLFFYRRVGKQRECQPTNGTK